MDKGIAHLPHRLQIGASGGGYAAARAVLTHPDVFQVAVSAAGNLQASCCSQPLRGSS